MILERALEHRGEELAGSTLTDRGWVASMMQSSGSVSAAGVPVTEWTAEGIPAMYACQRAISETLAQVPLKLIKYDGTERLPDTENPLYWVLHDLANPEMTAFTFKEMLTRHLVGWGNGYAEIVRDKSGAVIALWPLMPWRMVVDRDLLNRKRWRYTAPDGRPYEWTFDPIRPPILHLMINSAEGLVGRSPVRILMDSLGLTQAASRFGAEWFGKHAQPNIALKHPGRISKAAKDNLRKTWESLRGEWGSKHRTAVLEEGLSIEKYSCSPNESQFIETRSMQIEETARIYRVPLFVVQHMTKSTSWGTGLEQMMLGWMSTGLDPYFTQWQQVIARDCLTQRTFTTHKAVWIMGALLRTDIKSQSQALEIQKRNGVINANEWRAILDMNRRSDAFGDDYDVAIANTTPMSLAVAAAAAGKPATAVPDETVPPTGVDDQTEVVET